jgi:phage baseplate assembly protein W
MTTDRERGWLFLHPDYDTAPEFAGLQLSARGGIALVEGVAAVRQAILLLLSTMPGERVMRPDYGCELHRLLFAPNDDTTAGLAIFYVRRALERWEPRIEIVRLDANRQAQRPELLDVVLEYRLRATRQTDQVAFAVNMEAEEA